MYKIHGFTIANGVLLDVENPYKLRAWVQDQLPKCGTVSKDEESPAPFLERFNRALMKSEFSGLRASLQSIETGVEHHDFIDPDLILVIDTPNESSYHTAIN